MGGKKKSKVRVHSNKREGQKLKEGKIRKKEFTKKRGRTKKCGKEGFIRKSSK